MTVTAISTPTVTTHWGVPDDEVIHRWDKLLAVLGVRSPSRRLKWLTIFEQSFGHRPLVLEAKCDGVTTGMLPLAYMKSALFGKFLVSQPYLNIGGLLASDEASACQLIDRAVELANEMEVKHLELRNEERLSHAAFNYELTEKVHMRLELPVSADQLWKAFDPKVRNQVRKADKEGVSIHWGREELLRDFYAVFSRNMRDLGTPVFSRRLFERILAQLGDAAEICVARHQSKAIAGAILLHGDGVSEVPSASSLRAANRLNGNMLMYWHLLQRCVGRGQQTFDFGRSTSGSNTYRFKAQWGAVPHPAVWQYYVRKGSVDEMRPGHPKNQRRIAVWKRLPVWLTRLVGPAIVRGIP